MALGYYNGTSRAWRTILMSQKEHHHSSISVPVNLHADSDNQKHSFSPTLLLSSVPEKSEFDQGVP